MLLQAGARSDDLDVIVSGDVDIEKCGRRGASGLGRGDIVGEMGFLLGTLRTATLRAGAHGCSVWRVDRSVFIGDLDVERLHVVTRLCIALAPMVQVRLIKILEERSGERWGRHTTTAITTTPRSCGRPSCSCSPPLAT